MRDVEVKRYVILLSHIVPLSDHSLALAWHLKILTPSLPAPKKRNDKVVLLKGCGSGSPKRNVRLASNAIGSEKTKRNDSHIEIGSERQRKNGSQTEIGRVKVKNGDKVGSRTDSGCLKYSLQ